MDLNMGNKRAAKPAKASSPQSRVTAGFVQGELNGLCTLFVLDQRCVRIR